MKKNSTLLMITIINLISIHSFAQKKDDKILKEYSDKACQCIDSIVLYDKAKKDVVKEIHSCIDEEAGSYQIISKLSNVSYSDEFVKTDKKEEVNISVNMNKDSQDYKNSYYEIERYLMNNCDALKVAIASNEKQSEKSFSENPKALEFYQLGFDESKNGNFQKAIDYYNEAVKIDPDFAFAWDNIGIAYRRLEKYDQAIEAYEKSLSIDPYGVMPLQNIAIVYQFTEEYEKAIEAYERYGAIHPNNPEFYYGAGRVYAVFLNQHEKGLDYICKAYNLYIQENSPYRTDAEQVIGVIYQEMKKNNKEQEFLKVLEANKIGITE